MLGKSSAKTYLERRNTFASFKRQSEPRNAPASRRHPSLRRTFCLAHQDAPDRVCADLKPRGPAAFFPASWTSGAPLPCGADRRASLSVRRLAATERTFALCRRSLRPRVAAAPPAPKTRCAAVVFHSFNRAERASRRARPNSAQITPQSISGASFTQDLSARKTQPAHRRRID